MRLFVEAEVPEICYVTEAANWVALGRVPAFQMVDKRVRPGEHEHVDYRLGEDSEWNGEVGDYDDYISESEFRAFGIDIDYNRYINGIYGTCGVPGDEHLRNHILRTKELERMNDNKAINPDYEKIRESQLAQAKTEAREYDWAASQEEPFDAAIDRARALVFDALASGRLSARGWLAYSDLEKAQNDGEGPNGGRGGRLVDISPEKWTLRHLDWEEVTLKSGAQEFRGPLVSVSKLFELFPSPIGVAVEITGLLSAGSIILEGTSASMPRKNTRLGRPPKGSGLVRTAIQNEFSARKNRCELADKQEANIHAAIEWAEYILEEKVSRSSVQRWLANVT